MNLQEQIAAETRIFKALTQQIITTPYLEEQRCS
jgi:hypothetical protein